ncbi:hypothetical protein, partial [Shewanella sp.]|uniref:hypothetical protein n=1 Tax=Shewanella sp. TaxID=50422 RepID=UPI003D0EE0DB
MPNMFNCSFFMQESEYSVTHPLQELENTTYQHFNKGKLTPHLSPSIRYLLTLLTHFYRYYTLKSHFCTAELIQMSGLQELRL